MLVITNHHYLIITTIFTAHHYLINTHHYSSLSLGEIDKVLMEASEKRLELGDRSSLVYPTSSSDRRSRIVSDITSHTLIEASLIKKAFTRGVREYGKETQWDRISDDGL